MIRLIEPTEQYLASYIEACEEYKKNKVTTYTFTDYHNRDIFQYYDDCRNDRNIPINWVGSHYFWLVDDERDYFIGQISVRHKLTEALKMRGGHIGYGVRFCEWNKGYATYMLREALKEAKKIGLTKILLTCNDDNFASARVMEKNGFAMEDKVKNVVDGKTILTRRYWKNI